MTVRAGHRHVSRRDPARRSGSMEVMDSPLNLAHQQSRKAERLVAAGKYEEAICCHRRAADLLTDAMKTTESIQARLSMELQRDSHIKQQQLVQERWKRELRREASKARPGLAAHLQSGAGPLPKGPHSGQPQAHGASEESAETREREYDTLLYQLQVRQAGSSQTPTPSCSGSKTTKDDKTRLEEQQTTIKDLRRLVDHLLNENQRLSVDNERLRSENARLQSEAADFVERSELWVLPHAGGAMGAGSGAEKKVPGKSKEITVPQLPPLEMPAQEDLCLDDLPSLELPEDIQNELQELLDMK
ncbi:Nuclear receptor-binding factor 2 [Oryzias melastigma]|uniref:Nuclear receptor binding factor 2b n=1 Tax=Oryzias melastigma TaxID=30732 RepID=A0A3B3C863_ORYME|nr:nuclear receptor-binding factor 2b [Oryzias melastigma]KAF6729374.1 Nuclear receptor-binding factor 2 [Oryzias melastigma]